MIYQQTDLPQYPLDKDMWDELKKESRPIVVYGMGNGADKLFDRLCALGISVCDVFASDGFVRGHSFRGFRVKSFSEIKQTYGDFVILLSFASNRPEVIDMLADIDREYDMYAPDMPVAGVDEYFDREFYNDNYNAIKKAYDSLEDAESRNCFASVIRFKLSGRIEYLEKCYSTKEELYSLLGEPKTLIDAGAYNGDTLREAAEFLPTVQKAFAIEADRKNFKRLLKYVDSARDFEIIPLNSAAWSADGEGRFSVSGNRNSTAAATASFKHSDESVKLVRVDSLDFAPDYIKYDVEGGELEALDGSHATILKHRPTLLVSVYHRSRDIFSLINVIGERYRFYRLKLRRLRCLPAWEIDLVCTV